MEYTKEYLEECLNTMDYSDITDLCEQIGIDEDEFCEIMEADEDEEDDTYVYWRN